mmetsp:Transcript_23260/g.41252  ORF Transcript_23260/g.41252 Transcript_23260/m.41252 type:complete len:284 (+) Transcript_23260:1983-2834(+)
MLRNTSPSVPAPRSSPVNTLTSYSTILPLLLSASPEVPSAPTANKVCDQPFLLSNQSLYANVAAAPVVALVTVIDCKCHADPGRYVADKFTWRLCISPMSGAEKKKVSVLPRSKSFELDSKFFTPLSPIAPNTSTFTSASVPAPLTSLVRTSTLYRHWGGPPAAAGAPMPCKTSLRQRLPAAPLPLSARIQSSTGKRKLRCNLGWKISTCWRCQSGPGPEPSWPIKILVNAPTSEPLIVKLSTWPRSKLLAALSRIVSPMEPDSPWISINTFASVPAPRTSDV